MSCVGCEEKRFNFMKKVEQKKYMVKKRKALLKIWSTHVRLRDKECQICGRTERLQAHHLFSKQFYKALRYDITNGITVCASCHRFKGVTDEGSFHHSIIPIIELYKRKKKEIDYLIENHMNEINLDSLETLQDLELCIRRGNGYWLDKKEKDDE